MVATLIMPLAHAGHVSAEQVSITQELHVTAEVPHHRDIVIDRRGNILSITSNTTQDVLPDMYLLSQEPANKKLLSDALYKTYRTHVPVGADKIGVLYKAEVLQRLTVNGSTMPRLM